MSFWDVMWFMLISFALVAYLMVLFSIFGDLFRDPDTSGVGKAVWIVALVLLPLITSLIYMIVRGRDMARRSAEGYTQQRHAQEAYIREVAGVGSPAEEIGRAREMLDAGVITQPDFERLKAKALV